MKPRSFPGTDEQYARLPKYVKDYIEAFVRENVRLEDKVQRLYDKQTETNIWSEDYASVEFGKEYVQGEKVTFHHAGVWLRVNVAREDTIELQWSGGPSQYAMGEVALIPTSFQAARLAVPSNMSER